MERPKIEDYGIHTFYYAELEKYCDWLEGEANDYNAMEVAYEDSFAKIKQQIEDLEGIILAYNIKQLRDMQQNSLMWFTQEKRDELDRLVRERNKY